MSNDTNNMNTDKKSISYGAKLKAAREAMGLEQKDVAAQLRLGERIIVMLESGHYASDVPTTFIRGYIRSYSKLLQIPESDIAAALEPIKPAPAPQESAITTQSIDVTSSNYYMQFSTYAIVATLVGMLGLWWYNHTPSKTTVVAQEDQTLPVVDIQKGQDNKQVTILSPSTAITTATTNATAASSTTPPSAAAPATSTPASAPTVAAATPKPAIANPPRTHRVVEDEDDDDSHTD